MRTINLVARNTILYTSPNTSYCFAGVENFDNVLKLYRSAKSSLGEILSAFEMADKDAISTTVKNLNLP